MYTKSRRYTSRPNFNSSNSNRTSYRRSSSGRSGGGHKQHIQTSRFIKSATAIVDEVTYTPKNTFESLDIHPLIKSNVASHGYINPSPIQDQAIPLGLSGRDVVGIANTGTGKTAAFAIPMLHHLLNSPGSSALIIAPTRELAQQIEDECKILAKGSGLSGALLIGGTSMMPQTRDLKRRPSIVIGTPGRIKDHVQRGNLVLTSFDVIVLDEVDRMVDMGFITDIRFLLGYLPVKRQSYFFSATLDPKLQTLVESFLTDPTTVSVSNGSTADSVNQDVVRYSGSNDKMEKLHETLNNEATKKVLIFDATKHSVERLSKELRARGFKADALHGGKSQGQRQRALDSFKRSDINVLVATDVAARGIDVADITHVVNFSVPNTYDDYIHRIGRAGRAGRIGHALTFVES